MYSEVMLREGIGRGGGGTLFAEPEKLFSFLVYTLVSQANTLSTVHLEKLGNLCFNYFSC